jgi:hypothetical protein
MLANAVCEITHQAGNRSAMMSASIPFLAGAIMLTKRVLTVMLIATACVVGSTPSFARGGVVHLLARGGVEHGLSGGLVRNPTTLLGASPPPGPTFEYRIPRRSWHLSQHPS